MKWHRIISNANSQSLLIITVAVLCSRWALVAARRIGF